MKYHYRIVNVFTRDGATLSGNPLCVFEDARGLTQVQMQALAQQMNLSETTFVFPGTSNTDATVRIFTPAFEMPFAGHPTLGTAHVVADLQGKDSLRFDMHAGVIAVQRTKHRAWRLRTTGQLTARNPDFSTAQYAEMLQLPVGKVAASAGPIRWINTGSDQLMIPVADVEAVALARPIPALLMQLGKTSARAEPIAYVWAYEHSSNNGPCRRVTARLFFGSHGAVIEDPATGSACANLGGWLLDQGHHGLLQVTVTQGDAIGRPSTLRLDIDAHDSIFVTGEVIELGRGWFEL
jgi:trans-2,3-dihydro-3-hydroxyanthranilate isomerase